MSTIIGLGNAGCNIANKFEVYPQYNVIYFNTEDRNESNFHLIEPQEKAEDYEKNFPSIKKIIKKTSGPYTLIIGGSGQISAASLSLLQQLNSKDINILYVKPDLDLLSEIAYKRERIVFHVLQQYCRSDLLNKMFIVSNSKCENMLQDLTINNYFDKINDLIASTYHMWNVFQNIDPVIKTQSDPQLACKIATFGLVGENGQESLLYDLSFPREKCLYYSISKENLESDNSLIKDIKKQVRSLLTDKLKVSYAVYENDYDQNYIYSCTFASMIQEENYDFPLDDQ